MTKTYKRRQPKKRLPKMSKSARIYNRKRSFAEKFLIVMGIIIVLSMVISLVAGQLGGGHGGF
ncbi:MAG: hypothetical protein AAF490_28190 [Chloroflexota bacterium]